MNKVILVINAGSSSIKFSVFTNSKDLALLYNGIINIRDKYSTFKVMDRNLKEILVQKLEYTEYGLLFNQVFEWLHSLPENYILDAVGHRVVHGGTKLNKPKVITREIITQIGDLIHLAPLHQGHNLKAIEIIATNYPTLPQIACFDTSFHQTQQPLAKLFALPRELIEVGIIRYGFHGISYEYIATVIADKIGSVGNDRVIVAHLGNGASICAMHKGKSIATSMGFTALDGLMMGTRCGHIDPGIILYLQQGLNYSVDQVAKLLYQQSGLVGVSGISNDIRDLLESNDPHAIEAIDLFCYRAACEVGSLTVSLGGCDALVFTAGIGEHAAIIREKICAYLDFLGVHIDKPANSANAVVISATSSKVIVSVIPTNEEYMIAKHSRTMLGYDSK